MMRSLARTLALLLIAAATLAAPFQPAHAAAPAGPSVAYFSFPLTTIGLAEQVAQTGRLDLPLAAAETARLSLHETEVFAAGHKSVIQVDGTERPILARFFAGTLSDGEGPVSITIAPEGVYGGYDVPGRSVSFQPLAWSGGHVSEQVRVVTWASTSTATSGASTTPSGTASALTTTKYFFIKPFSEPSYRSYKSDYANRISSAFAYSSAVSMWSGETNIVLEPTNIVDLGVDYPSLGGCGFDEGLQNFHDSYAHTIPPTAPVNAYALFHAYDGTKSIAGCSYTNCAGVPSGCLQTYVVGYPHTDLAISALQAKDWSGLDTYDPTTTHDLAVTLHHELTHLAGEPDHPSDGNCFTGTDNLMANGVAFFCSGFWRTSGTIGRVNSYAIPRL